MKELENGKKKLLITGMILIIIAVCTAGIFAYGSHKNNQKAAAKVQEESVQRASQEQSLAAQKEQEQKARSIAEAELQKALSEAQSRDESIAASEAESREQAQKEAEEASIAQEKAEQEAREEQERQAQGAGLAERLAGYETVSRPAGSTGDIICIDPGHQSRGNNGKEPEGPGSQTMKTKVAGGTGGVVSGVPEYQLTLTIGMMLKLELQNRGYTVVMTRESNDVDISNKERARRYCNGGGSSGNNQDSRRRCGQCFRFRGFGTGARFVKSVYTGTGRQFQSVRKLYYQFVLCGNRNEKPRGSRK